MIKNDNELIIEGEKDLKDPFMCYCLMMKWMEDKVEDYIDQNELIVMPVPFIMWLNGRKYITNGQADELLHAECLTLQEIMDGKVLFSNTHGRKGLASYKKYQLLAEYISCFKELRKRLYETATDDEELYKNENVISSVCLIPITECLVTGRSVPKNWRVLWDWSWADTFEKVKKIPITEINADLEV